MLKILSSLIVLFSSIQVFAGGEGTGPGIIKYLLLASSPSAEVVTQFTAVKFVNYEAGRVTFKAQTTDGNEVLVEESENSLDEMAPLVIDAVAESFESSKEEPVWVEI